jgi:nucleotide-binding universal stress UspA family protein
MGYRNILVTLDGSKLSELALQHAVRVAEPGASIYVLSVLAEEGPTSEVAALASARAYQTPQADRQWPQTKNRDLHEADARKKYLHEVSEWLQPAGYSVNVEARPGSTIDTILEVSRRGFDVIVMATHARTGMNKTVLGSVTEAVLRDAPCPVLVVTPNSTSSI